MRGTSSIQIITAAIRLLASVESLDARVLPLPVPAAIATTDEILGRVFDESRLDHLIDLYTLVAMNGRQRENNVVLQAVMDSKLAGAGQLPSDCEIGFSIGGQEIANPSEHLCSVVSAQRIENRDADNRIVWGSRLDRVVIGS